MKKGTAALIGSAALAVASGLLFFHLQDKEEAILQDVAQTPSKTYTPRKRAPQEQRIAGLAEQKSAVGRDKLIQLYGAWAGKPEFDSDRRAIISHIMKNEEPWMALNLIIAAVSSDPIPLEDDDMLDTIARDMVGLLKDDYYVGQARDQLRLTNNVKARALLAESLSWRLNSPPSDLPSVEGQRHQLTSDLMQTYLHTADVELKRRLIQNVATVANADVAEILANPENAEHSKLAQKLDQERKQAAAAALSSK